jgi:hypothetical protein
MNAQVQDRESKVIIYKCKYVSKLTVPSVQHCMMLHLHNAAPAYQLHMLTIDGKGDCAPPGLWQCSPQDAVSAALTCCCNCACSCIVTCLAAALALSRVSDNMTDRTKKDAYTAAAPA